MKIKDQTRKLATGCSKQCFEVDTVLRLQIKLTKGFEVVDTQNTGFEVAEYIRQGDVDAV
ncbi:N-ethylammeline chlorohydrolase [Streptococcus pneumoniae]|nr:N-ethylammeline chlorohydrolase [Streptococcus pneumoniae]